MISEIISKINSLFSSTSSPEERTTSSVAPSSGLGPIVGGGTDPSSFVRSELPLEGNGVDGNLPAIIGGETESESIRLKRSKGDLIPLRFKLIGPDAAIVFWVGFRLEFDEIAVNHLDGYGIKPKQLALAQARYEKHGLRADCTDAIGNFELMERPLNGSKSDFSRVRVKFKAKRSKCLPYALLNPIQVIYHK